MTSAPPPYSPAPYLLNGPLLTAPQLISHFQDFYGNLEYVSSAPSLVFERLVGNLNTVFAIAFERERLEHAAALKSCQEEIELLQLSIDQLKKELGGWKEIATTKRKTPNPVVKPKTTLNPVVGTFHTSEVRSGKNPPDRTSKEITFASPYPALPGLAIGLNALDMSKDNNIRVVAHASNIQKDRFNINITTRHGTLLHGGGCAWLEVVPDDPDFQFGTFNSAADFPCFSSTRLITFPRAYSAPPRVVVWLKDLDISCKAGWRVKTYDTNVSATGFTIHIDTWSDTVLYSATATWVAYPADKPKIFSGRFNTMDVRPWNRPQLYNSAHVNFGSNIFTSPPRIFLALNSLDLDCTQNLRLRATASNINAIGMTWYIDSWDTSILYSAGASYIALG